MAFSAICDTGATNSAISQKVVDACKLSPTGITRVQGVHGVKEVETYLVNISLPSNVTIANVRVTKGDLGNDDILIGMDVISRGDFAVTDHGGITKFSFRIPSMEHIDFVTEINPPAGAPAQNRAARRRRNKNR